MVRSSWKPKLERLTSWEFPNVVTVGFEETRAGSHSLIALWSSFKWPYLGSLIKPEINKVVFYNFSSLTFLQKRCLTHMLIAFMMNMSQVSNRIRRSEHHNHNWW